MKFTSLFLLILLLGVSQAGFSQVRTIDDLNREKAKLQSIIERNSKLMNEYADRRNNEMMKISMVDTKISKRKSLIEVYETEIETYKREVNVISHKIDSVESEVRREKEEYAEMLRHMQARGMNYSPLAYILSSQSFNQSYRRFLFLKQYSDYRKQQFDRLNASIETLGKLKESVEERLAKVKKLMEQMQSESVELNKELTARKENVESINQSQVDLKTQIEKAQEQTRKLEEQIVAIIKEEAERARREAEEARKKAEAERLAAEKKARENAKKPYSESKPEEKVVVKTEAEIISEDILANKGKLPWPVRSFVITSYFGEHDHPLVPSIKVRNNGIDIDILASKDVHPVHKGRVSRIIMIPGSSASVIVRHGTVLTVYSNLSQVFVKKDQEVDVNTNIGTVFTGEGINSNILHFEIWKDDQKQNPESWLKNQ